MNLTQHFATPEQVSAGVTDLEETFRAKLVALLNFETLPSWEEVKSRAAGIATLAENACYNAGGNPKESSAMIGGAPFLMPLLEEALEKAGIMPCYAFSVRESVETVQPDGSVRKTAVFRHAGFVPGRMGY
jgi:hypothetical protein